MHKIKLAAPAIRKKYRKNLDKEKKKSAFDRLVTLLQTPPTGLDWYWELGSLVKKLCGAKDRTEAYGKMQIKNLGNAVGVRDSLLRKANRFREEYPNQADVTVLKNLPTDWTRLTLAFPIEKDKRHDFLLETAQKHWNVDQLRAEVQDRIKSTRRGAGGRKERKPLPKRSPETALRDLKRLSEEWMQFQDQVWAKIPDSRWERFAKNWPAKDREKLETLLGDTATRVAEVAGTATAGQETLGKLLSQIKPFENHQEFV